MCVCGGGGSGSFCYGAGPVLRQFSYGSANRAIDLRSNVVLLAVLAAPKGAASIDRPPPVGRRAGDDDTALPP